MYESGARPEEFLRLTNNDFIIDTKGIWFILRGKTGERRVLIITYSKLFQQWLDVHPLKHQPNYSVWVSESTNYKNKPLGIRGAEKIIENTLTKLLPEKHARLYILRHSRATHLAKRLTEAQFWAFFGWSPGTKVVSRYVHLSGRDLDGTLLSLAGTGNTDKYLEDYKIRPISCIRCCEGVRPGSQFCAKCGLSVNLQDQYMKETDLEQKNRLLELKIETIEQKMNEKLRQLILMIQKNPKLAMIKPEVILENI
jgi:integrase/recombinase XerD